MSPEMLLERFGYFAVFAGTFLEGEVILVMAGFFAQRGHLELLPVILIGFTGAYLGHIFWFWLGRRYGVRLLDRFPRLKNSFGRGIRLFERYGPAAIIITQWVYGLRITAAVIIGMSRIPILKFLVYQAFSCAAWAIVIGGTGFYFGHAVERILGKAENIEKWGLLVLVVIATTVWAYHRWKERRAEAG